MEVILDKRYPLEASVEQAWAVLSDIRAVGGCMPGAQITDQLDDTHYKGTVKTRIGPASMQFNGDIEVLGLEAGVNVTVGLPFVRTSVDHGTAFDIAGKGIADEQSLLEAIGQALQMTGVKTA